ncbi:MAG: Clp protease N-terminal domain-containing protein, partial [Syntrophales bacterium]
MDGWNKNRRKLTMRFDKFTLKVQEAIQDAQGLAGQSGHQAIDPEHLLVSFLKRS